MRRQRAELCPERNQALVAQPTSSGHWSYIAMSVILHAALAAGLALHWQSQVRHTRHAAPSIAIDATLVGLEQAGLQGTTTPETPAAPSAPTTPPPRTVEAARKDSQSKPAAERSATSKRQQVRNSKARQARASWQAQIAASIERAWQIPPTAPTGVECTLRITQDVSGAVENVDVIACNGDDNVQASIEAAARRASPLPPAPSTQQFVRTFTITVQVD
jgi:TonB family protein